MPLADQLNGFLVDYGIADFVGLHRRRRRFPVITSTRRYAPSSCLASSMAFAIASPPTISSCLAVSQVPRAVARWGARTVYVTTAISAGRQSFALRSPVMPGLVPRPNVCTWHQAADFRAATIRPLSEVDRKVLGKMLRNQRVLDSTDGVMPCGMTFA
jgi:hypothetical protein